MDDDFDWDWMNRADDGSASSASRSPPELSDAEIYAQVSQDVQNAQAALTSSSDPSAVNQTPQIDGGLLDPRTFPSHLNGGAPPAAPSAAGVDPDTMAEVEQDVQKAQAALQQPPAPSPSPPDPEVEADVRAAQAALPRRLPTANPGFRHIDAYPGMNYAPPGRFALPTHDDYVNFLNGVPVSHSAYGPHITFSPGINQPVTDPTATMVERAVVNSGVNSVNISSTTGGKHSLDARHNSAHYSGRAIDVNTINDRRVAPGYSASQALQNAFAQQPNVMEDFGPAYQNKIFIRGTAPRPVPSVASQHKTHDHFSGWD